MHRRLLFIGVILLVTVVGGLLLVTGDDPTDSRMTPISDGGDSTDPSGGDSPQIARIIISPLEVPGADGELPVEISTEIRGYDNLSYEHVRLCAYDRNGTVLDSTALWTIQSPSSGTQHYRETVNLTVEQVPKYLIIDGPNLRSDERLNMVTQEWRSEEETYVGLRDDLGTVQNEFEWPQTSEPGQCG